MADYISHTYEVFHDGQGLTGPIDDLQRLVFLANGALEGLPLTSGEPGE